MTGVNVMDSFMERFKPEKTVSDTVEWIRDHKTKICTDLDSLHEKLATKGVLSREERTQYTSDRNTLLNRLIYDDPGCITNKYFDEWIRTTGLYDEGYSQNENRANNISRLNRLFKFNEEKFILTSRSHKKVVYLMDTFMASKHELENFHEDNSTTIKNRVNRAAERLKTVARTHQLETDFVSRIETSLETSARRISNADADQEQMLVTIAKFTNMIEDQTRKLLV